MSANRPAATSIGAPPARRRRRARTITAAILLAVVVLVGLAVHALLPDTHATDIAGDALYAAAVCLALVMVAPRWPAGLVGAVAAAWCVAVELFQLSGIPLAVGTHFPPAILILGTVFDARDLVVYVVTVVAVTTVDAMVTSLVRRR